MRTILEAVGELIFLLIYPFLLIQDNIVENIKFRREEKEWHEQSFVFENGRYRTDTFKILDGKIVFK